MTVKTFSLLQYIEAALKVAEYEKDESGGIVVSVPGTSGFFAQGETHEDARENLKEVIENVVILRLQLGWEIPTIPGVVIKEEDVKAHAT